MRYIRLSAVLLLAACGDGGTTPTKPTPLAPSVTLSATSLSFSSVGETQQLSATVKDQNGATLSGVNVMWFTSVPAVATVSSAGLVTSVANGTASILASYGSVNATATVSVAQVPSTVEVSPSTSNLLLLTWDDRAPVADTITLSATVKDSVGSEISDATVTWATSDTLIATVTSEGFVTAVSVGTVFITATSGSITGKAVASVVPSDVTVADASAELDKIIDRYAFTGARLTDELSGTGSYFSTGQYRLGRITREDTELFWEQTHKVILAAGEGLARLQALPGSASFSSPEAAQLWYLLGTAHQRLGENFCYVVYNRGALQPRTASFDSAVAAFNQAKTIGGAANSSVYQNAGWGGLAQAYVGLGDWGSAVQAAGNVPTDFVIEAQYDQHGDNNEVYQETSRRAEAGVWATPVQRQYNPTVANYKSTVDPRVPYTVCGTWNDTARPPDVTQGVTATGICTASGPNMNGGPRAADGLTANYRQDKYDEYGSNIPTISGIEMRLIEAESDVRVNSCITFVVRINQVRAYYGADPLSAADEAAACSGPGSLNWDNCWTWAADCDVNTIDDMWSILDRERYMTLWLEGRRLWDLHRWDHPFLNAGTLIGLGEPRRASCMPIPENECTLNPNIANTSACTG